MPAGLPYFAWVDASETTFGAEHLRWDESVFSFTLSQNEGDPASLTVVVRRPLNEAGDAIGLLGPGRKIWCWFALDCGPGLIKFRGRLVGIPTSIFEELVTLEFVARPFDVVAQKEALANTLRVLPFYDEAVIDKERAKDPDVVLEGYTAIWHYDRETHVVTISSELTGDDGLVEFDGASETGKVLYDGLGLTLTSGPLSRVDVSAVYTWTQQANGSVDLTNYLLSNWPGSSNGAISSYTLWAADWPKTGAGIGDGWKVAEASAYDLYDFTVKTHAESHTTNIDFGEGLWGPGSASTTFTNSTAYIGIYGYGGQRQFSSTDIVTQDSYSMASRPEPDDVLGGTYITSMNRQFAAVADFLPVQAVNVRLVAGYTAERQCTERVTFSLFADVQPILTDPEDGEALRIDDVRSVNLTEAGMIGDPRRRSYIATERGNQSLEHLIALARTNLMKRARVVEIAFAPKLARMPEITLRKSVFLAEPRVGQALGKIIGYSISLDGADGRVNCEVRIGCTIGRGGLVTATDGMPSYCSIDYVGFDYQQFVDRTVLVDGFADSSVGYQPPNANPNDDGINFLSVRADEVIETGLTVEFALAEQEAFLQANPFVSVPAVVNEIGSGLGFPDIVAQSGELTSARSKFYQDLFKQMETKATFKLKSMTREFSTDYELQVTDLKIPTGYDLEAGVMAGFEVIVRPMIFPNIRPAPARSLPPEDDPESGFAMIQGSSGKHIDLPYSWGFSLSKSKPQETERRVDRARVHQREDDGTINRDNFIDIDVANKITMDETKGPGAGTPGVGSGTPGVGAETTKSEMKEYFYERIKETDDKQIEIKRKDIIMKDGVEVK